MKHRPPTPDRYQMLYAGILAAGFTLHLDGAALRIEPAERVTPSLAAHVKRHEQGLRAHLQAIEAAEDARLGKRLDEVKPLAF